MKAWSRTIRLAAVVLSLISLSLFAWAQTAGTGKLKTKVNPGRAGVFVDGKYIGPAANFGVSRTYAVPAGDHEVLLTEPRYKDIKEKVTIQAGKTTVLSKTMEALPAPKGPFGRLRVVQGPNDKFGAVYLNEKYMGHIDEFSNSSQGLLINPGEYQLRIASATGGKDYVETITVKENQVTTVKAGAK